MKQYSHRISVVIPCYNAENYIGECIESIINQTIGFQNIEVILIDDASTDSSLSYLQNYTDKYENISLVSLRKNEGQANARNIGLSKAHAKYVTFVDVDDWLELNAYEKLLIPTEEYEYDLIQCSMLEHLEGLPPKQVNSRVEGRYREISKSRQKFVKACDIGGVIGCSIYRTRWLREQGIAFKKFEKYEDNFFVGEMKYFLDSYCAISDALYHYRILEKSNSHARNDMKHFARLNVELEKLKYYVDKGFYDIYYDEIRDEFLTLFYKNTLHIIFCQFDYVPLKQIRYMQSVVKQVYPDYLEYCRSKELYINPIITVAFDFPLEIWERYKQAYLAWVTQKEEEHIVKLYASLRKTLNL